MNSSYLTIKQAAQLLNVSIDTLRRWDKKGKLRAVRNKENGYRYYPKETIELYLRDIFALAKKWAIDPPSLPEPEFYCSDSLIFKTRLNRLENTLMKMIEFKDTFSFLTSVVGEIGNNSYDHNLGNWPDIRGIFFAYDLNKRQIALADRGQGLLKTLRKVKPELRNDQEALLTAFTEVISSRAPEARGNGLKYVRQVIESNPYSLEFYSGGAKLCLAGKFKKINIKNNDAYYNGCVSLIRF